MIWGMPQTTSYMPQMPYPAMTSGLQGYQTSPDVMDTKAYEQMMVRRKAMYDKYAPSILEGNCDLVELNRNMDKDYAKIMSDYEKDVKKELVKKLGKAEFDRRFGKVTRPDGLGGTRKSGSTEKTDSSREKGAKEITVKGEFTDQQKNDIEKLQYAIEDKIAVLGDKLTQTESKMQELPLKRQIAKLEKALGAIETLTSEHTGTATEINKNINDAKQELRRCLADMDIDSSVKLRLNELFKPSKTSETPAIKPFNNSDSGKKTGTATPPSSTPTTATTTGAPTVTTPEDVDSAEKPAKDAFSDLTTATKREELKQQQAKEKQNRIDNKNEQILTTLNINNGEIAGIDTMNKENAQKALGYLIANGEYDVDAGTLTIGEQTISKESINKLREKANGIEDIDFDSEFDQLNEDNWFNDRAKRDYVKEHSANGMALAKYFTKDSINIINIAHSLFDGNDDDYTMEEIQAILDKAFKANGINYQIGDASKFFNEMYDAKDHCDEHTKTVDDDKVNDFVAACKKLLQTYRVKQDKEAVKAYQEFVK